MILQRSPSRSPQSGISGVTSGVRGRVTADNVITFSSYRDEPGVIPLTDRRGRRRSEQLEESLLWQIDAAGALLDDSLDASKGYELFWIWGPGRGLDVRGLENGTAWSWDLMPSGYTHKGPVSAFAATDASEDLIPSTTEDGFFSYDPDSDDNDLLVLEKTSATEEDVDFSPVIPASRKWLLCRFYFHHSNSTLRDAYMNQGSSRVGLLTYIASASGATRSAEIPVFVPNAGLGIDEAASVLFSGTISGNGAKVWALAAQL